MLLIISFSVTWLSFATIYTSYYGYLRWLIEIPRVLLAFGGLNFFTILYLDTLKNKVMLFTSGLFFLQLFAVIYFSLIHPINLDVNLNDVKGWGIVKRLLNITSLAIVFYIVTNVYKNILKKYNNDNIYFIQIRKWSLMVVIIITLLVIANILNSINHNFEKLTVLLKGLAYFSILLFIQYRPLFLNNSNLKITLGDTFSFKNLTSFSPTFFNKEFIYNHYYLNKEANVNELSEKLGTNCDVLQDYIKEKYELSFAELINKYRVEYFVSLINSGKYSHHTIDYLSKKCGFLSRQNLYKSFKKFHGGSPSDLIKATTFN